MRGERIGKHVFQRIPLLVKIGTGAGQFAADGNFLLAGMVKIALHLQHLFHFGTAEH